MRQLKITNSITTREAVSLQKYLQEISKLDLLTPEEEVQLTVQIRKGDQVALERLTKANLRFVVSVAKKYQGQGLSLPDLINEGNLGLIQAASKFDDTKGFRFISFAVWWIRQNILQAIAEHARLIRLPLNKVALSNRVRRAQTELEQHLERMPSTEELADALQMEQEEVSRILGQSGQHLSLDTPISGEDEGTLMDTLENMDAKRSDAELSHHASLQMEIKRAMETLSCRQQETLRYFFGIGEDYPLSLEDIAHKFDLTTERVRQIKDKALEKLRAIKNAENLREFMGY